MHRNGRDRAAEEVGLSRSQPSPSTRRHLIPVLNQPSGAWRVGPTWRQPPYYRETHKVALHVQYPTIAGDASIHQAPALKEQG